MSIQTELTRIINAKAAIKAAIEGKGVTVPDGTLLDGMAALVEEIQSGSGHFDFSLLGDVNFVKSGSFTPAEDKTTIIVDDYDFITITPKLYILYTESALTTTDKFLPLAIIQAHISDETGFVLGVWTKGLQRFTTINTSYFKPFHFNATSSVTTNDAYKFVSSSVLCPCSKTTRGFIARASSYRSSDSSYAGYFEAGATYNYVYMGVKQ